MRLNIDDKWYVFAGKEKSGPFDDFEEFGRSSDGKVLAYKAKIDGKYYLFTDKEKSGPFDDIGESAFSPHGETLAYIAEIDGKTYYKVIIDGSIYPGSIGPDGKTVYVKNGKIMLRE